MTHANGVPVSRDYGTREFLLVGRYSARPVMIWQLGAGLRPCWPHWCQVSSVWTELDDVFVEHVYHSINTTTFHSHQEPDKVRLGGGILPRPWRARGGKSWNHVICRTWILMLLQCLQLHANSRIRQWEFECATRIEGLSTFWLPRRKCWVLRLRCM